MKLNVILFLHTVEPGLPSIIRIDYLFRFDLKHVQVPSNFGDLSYGQGL